MVAIGVIAATVVMVPAASPADAAVRRSFTPRYRTNDRGDIIAIGNTSVSCITLLSGCAAARAGSTSSSNNDFIGAYVDVDSNLTTVNSSQATLTLPAGSTVLWAGLYWAGSAADNLASRSTVRLAGPGGTYTTISGTVTTGAVATTGGYPYSGFADVTSLVQASGTYTVADVATTVGQANSRGGWSIVTVVRDPSQPLRNLSVFDGYAEINGSAADSTVTTTISGFLTPTSGAVSARIGAVTSEGDLGLTGDAFRFNGVTVSDALNPATNFWNSSISRLGTRVTAKNPDYANQLGIDIDYLAAPSGAISNGQTSATATFTTGGESYEPIALFTAIDIFEPNLTATKVGTDVNGGKLNPGDVMEYAITLNSTGNESAATVRLADVMPTTGTYVPGSITVNGGAVTDATGDDIGEYAAASRTITVRLGSGATATAGGTLAPAATSVVRFRVAVAAAPAAGASLSNQATVTYVSPTTGTQYTTQTDDPGAPGSSNSTDTDINDAPVTNAITASTLEDTPTTLSLTGASSDPDGDTLTYTTSAIPPTQGTLSCTAGSCTFTPALNFNGPVSFTYTATDTGGRSSTASVTINVTAVNDLPVAVNDSYTIGEDTVGTFTVTANDSDVETANAALAVTAFTQGSKGSVSCTGGTCTYTPQPNVNGTDSFTYVVSDGNGGTATATVNVTITPVQDAPIATGMAVSVNEDPPSPLSINVLDGDTDPDGDTVRLFAFTQPAPGTGTVTCTPNTGPCLYTPPANYNGTTSFTYTAIDTADGTGRQSTATIVITVLPVNDRPVAVDDAATVSEDAFVDVDVLLNDSDIDGGALRIPSFTQPANGTVDCGVLPGAGPCRYTPKPNFNGTDTFTYEVNDGNGGQSTGVVTITVSAVNDPPVAVGDNATTSEDAPVTVNVLANDTDIDGNVLTVSSPNPTAANGVVSCSTTACTYTPNTDFNGVDSFTYTISDGAGGTASATVTVTVGAINDAPLPVGDTATVNEDASVVTDVLANDADPDVEPIAIVAVIQPAHGSVSCGPLPGLGPCTYTPTPNFNGADSYTYTVADAAGARASATVNVTVLPANDPPVAGNDAATTNEDTSTVVDVSAGDLDIDGDVLSYAVATQPANGTVSCTGAGACTYTPNPNFNGTDTFTYTVTDPSGASATGTVQVVVIGVNDPPVPDAGSATTAEDSPVAIDVLAGDTDPDGDPLSIAVVSTPANGVVSCGPLPSTLSCVYTPNPNFNGTDSFTYTVSDGRGGTASAVVTVTVGPVNDPPVAGADAATTAEDTTIDIDVAANDRDVDAGDTLTFAPVGGSAVGGTVTCTPVGVCTFVPTPNFNGPAGFSYTVTDLAGATVTGTVTVNVEAVNDAPVAAADAAGTPEDTSVTVDVRANDGDVDGDTVTIVAVSQPANGSVDCGPLPSTGTCTYTPNPNFNGTDTFTYTIADGNGGTASATATITVAAANDDPVADPDSGTTDEDVAVVIDVLAGDTDVDTGDALAIVAVSQPANGSVDCGLLPSTGTCTYTPNPNFNGTDTFTYTVGDGNGGTAVGTVTVLVRATNDPPQPDDDTADTDEDVAVVIDVLVGDTDPDAGDVLTIAGASNGANGTVTCTTTQCTYTPNPNFNGTDTFTYTVRDGSGSTAAATVTVTVAAQNDDPQVLDRAVGTREDTASAPIPVLQGASDVDGDTVSLVSFTQGTSGAVNCTLPTGPCTYTPGPNFNGSDAFTFSVDDGNGGTATGTITVTVTAVNDLPAPQPDAVTIDEDEPITISTLLANDTDPDGDTLAIVPDATPRATANGTVQCTATACTYTPRLNYNGTDSFTYDVVDPAGARTTTTVAVTIDPVNDAPTPQDGSATTPEDTPLAVPVGFVLANDTDPDGDPLEAIAFTQPAPNQGTVSCNPPGPPYFPSTICTFTPALDFTGTATWTYTVSDPGGLTADATITVFVGPVNDAPTPADDAVTTDEDEAIDIDVLANDTDPDDAPTVLSVVPDASPRATANGTVQCSTTGCVYTPRLNFNGTDTFTYDVVDDDGASATATVTVTVTSVNDAPTPQPGTGVTPEDTPLTVPVGFVLSNDTDPDGDPLEAIEFTQPDPATGSVSCPGAAPYPPATLCTFTPAPNFVGETTFEYTVRDPGGRTASTTIRVVVTAVNDAPTVPNQTVTTTEDVALQVNALLGAVDVEGDPLTVTSWTQPANGTVTCTPAGACTYTPNLNYNGPDTFTVVVDDGNGGTDTVTIDVTVDAVNDPPTAAVIEAETDEDAPVTFDGLAGASDPDHPVAQLTITGIVTQPTGGSVVCAPTGSCTYTPNANFNGTDTFQYTIADPAGGSTTATATITVNSINDAPDAVNDGPVALDEDSAAITVPVLTNDTDPDGDSITIVAVTGGTKGTFSCGPTSCTYTPYPDANGTDTVTYTVTDGQGGFDSATVTFAIAPVNDAPTAAPLERTTAEDVALSFDALSGVNDVDGPAATVTGYTQPTNGTVVCDPAGACTFTPNADATGDAVLTVTIDDGAGGVLVRTVTIAVSPVNDPPVPAFADAGSVDEDGQLTGLNVLAGATDVDAGDTVSFVSATNGAKGVVSCTPAGVCSYTPNANANGADTFTYTIRDVAGAAVSRTVTVTINPINDAPTAPAQAITLAEDDRATIDLRAGIGDVDGDALTVEVVTGPANGTLVCQPDDTCVYTPAADYNGPDQVTVRITDGNGGEVVVTHTFTVSPVNDAPVAVADTASIDEDGVAEIDVLDNDTDTENGAGLTIVTANPVAARGTVVCSATSCTYTPDPNFNGTDSFSYTVQDTDGLTSSATVVITVAAVNDVPVAPALETSTPEDTPLEVDPFAGTADADGDTLSVVDVDVPAGASFDCGALPSTGPCTFVPPPNATGTFVITVSISDGVATVTRSITIEVTAVNDAPVAGDVVADTDEDTAVEVPTAPSSSDPDGPAPALDSWTQPANGTVACDTGTGVCTYTPAPDFAGTDTFTYTVIDAAGVRSTGTVTVTVRPVNDAPTPGSGSGTTPEDTPLFVNVAYILANDTDPDPGDTFEAIAFTQPANGTATCFGPSPYAPDTICRYLPNPNFVGTDSFQYTVRDAAGALGVATITVIVTPVNDPPTVVDEAVEVEEDTPTPIDVLANDSDIEDDALTIVQIGQPQFGTVDCGPLPSVGPCVYTPNTNSVESDSFTYVVSDGNLTTAGTVTISILPVNDPPQAPDRGFTTAEEQPVVFDALDGAIDPDGTPVTFVAATQPPAGTGTVVCTDATCTYTPPDEYSGTTTFTLTFEGVQGLQVTSTITVVVTPTDDPPIGGPDEITVDEDSGTTTIPVLDNDRDPEGLPLTIVGFTQGAIGAVTCTTGPAPPAACTYTPGANASGPDTFSYTLSDGVNQTVVSVAVTVNAVPDPPIAVDDSATVDEDQEVVIPVLANDSDPDGGTPGLVTIVTPPDSGTVRVNPDSGEIAYTPANDTNGTFTFQYQTCDTEGLCAVATVTVTVNPVPDDPVAEDVTAVTDRDVPVTTSLLDLAADVDGDLDAASLALTGAPANGQAVLNPDGTVTYTPDAGFVGSDSFGYRICDSRSVCVEQTVNIEVVVPSIAPQAQSDARQGRVNRPVVVDVLANDVALGRPIDATSVAIVTPPANGTVSVDPATGAVTYTPAAGFTGRDTFVYEVCEQPGVTNGEGIPLPPPKCAQATASIVIEAEPPVTTPPTTTIPPTVPPTTTTPPTGPPPPPTPPPTTQPPLPSPPGLPSTGGNSGTLVAYATAILAAGVLAVVIGLRRRGRRIATGSPGGSPPR